MNHHSRFHHAPSPSHVHSSSLSSLITSYRRLVLVSTLILLLGPDLSFFSSPSSASSLCSAAPAFWTPLTDAFDALIHPHGNAAEEIKPEPAATVPVAPSDSGTSVSTATVHLTATADDYGVVQLDLEGDPNCDYTTKVKIAGTEYNVIIDTGSAHFAVASSACRDCVIPHKDHYRPNEEEEIPIDMDPVSISTTVDHGDSLNSLLRPRPPAFAPIIASLLSHSIFPSSTADIEPLKATPSINATPQNQFIVSLGHSFPSAVLPSRTATTATTSTTTTATPFLKPATIVPAPLHNPGIIPVDIPHNNQDTLTRNNSDFLSRESQVRAMATSLGNHLTGLQPNNQKPLPLLASLPTTIAVEAKMSIQTRSSAITTRNERKSNISSSSKQKRGGKALVAAPAENLYPLSDTAKEHGGQTIRVSYGIKSHSVGWSGVMTSDLMTIEMAKVIPPGNKVAAVNGAVTTDMTLKPGETMEKEVNVEFAAIMENTGFFSQECGAQHGIWGLGYSSLSVDHKPTLLDTLSARMKIPNGFALQLCGRTANTTKSGNIFLGGYAQSHIVDPMQFVPLVKKDWYQVRLDGFKVKGEPVKGMVNLNLPKTIVDSGTTNILMSHYNLQFLIQSLASSGIVKWSSLIPEQDVQNFWFKNAVLRLPRSSFEIVTQARAVEVVLSGIDIPIYTSSFLRIKTVPPGQAPAGYVDFWWHGFASSTSPDAVEAEHESGGAVMPGSVGTILGETLFAGKVVYFERGNDDAEPGDADFGRIGFARGQNCFGPSTHSSVDVLAAQGELAKIDVAGLGPVRVAATSDANARLGPVGSSSSSSSSSGPGSATTGQFPNVSIASIPTANNNTGGQHTIHFKGFDGPIRLMGGGGMSLSPLMSGETNTGFLRTLAASLIVAVVAGML